MRMGTRTPCRTCARPCYGPACHKCSRVRHNPRAVTADIPTILAWAQELRTEQAISAYARKKAAA